MKENIIGIVPDARKRNAIVKSSVFVVFILARCGVEGSFACMVCRVLSSEVQIK
jgi:hypothetical protein